MTTSVKPKAAAQASAKTLPPHNGPLKTATVSAQLAALQGLSLEELREKWTTLYVTDPPKFSRKLFIKRLSYRIQELAYGGLSDATKERMDRLMGEYGMDEFGRYTDPAKAPGKINRAKAKKNRPTLGTKMIRVFQGVQHEVLTVTGGYEYNGKTYKSLSVIARTITGSRWNGPRFFGLRPTGVRGGK